MARELKRLGAQALSDVILEDERGLTQIDHLVRGTDRLLVLETKTLGGRISGTPLCASWTQHLGHGELERVTVFQSPLWQNLRHVRAAEAFVAPLGVPVIGHVVMAGPAALSAELQTVVTPLAALAGVIAAPMPLAAGRDTEAAWGRLTLAAAAGGARREEHAEVLRTRRRRFYSGGSSKLTRS